MKKRLALFILTIASVLRGESQAFIENKGQIINQYLESNSKVLFLMPVSGMNVQLTKTGFSYDIISRTENREINDELEAFSITEALTINRIDIEFEGMNPAFQVEKSNPSPTVYNYYTTGTSEKGVTNVPSFEKITYKNIYEGVDVVFYKNANGQFEYDIVSKNVLSAEQVKLKYSGVIIKDGVCETLDVLYANEILHEMMPKCYTEKGENINVKYDVQNQIVKFKILDSLNKKTALTIDPIPNLQFASYLGGNNTESISNFQVDSDGSLFVVGGTTSTTNIATIGAFQTTINSPNGRDGFMAKIDSNNTLQWCTYYGGIGNDDIGGITLSNSSILICGSTISSDIISTTGAYQEQFGGGFSDGFVANFTTNGTRIWSTYFGGSGSEGFTDIEADQNSGAMLVGYAYAGDLVMIGESIQQTVAGNSDGLIAEWDLNGLPVFSTYLGGTNREILLDIEFENSGKWLVSGYTKSTDGIALGSQSSSSLNGTQDGWVCLMENHSVLWSEYIGGAALDQLDNISFVGSDKIVLGGGTSSSDLPTTIGAFEANPSSLISDNEFDGMIYILDLDGNTTYCSYYTHYPAGLSVCDAGNGNFIVAGSPNEEFESSTTNAWQSLPNFLVDAQTNQNSHDLFITNFNSLGQRNWSTYFGDVSDEYGNVKVKNGVLIICGLAYSNAPFSQHLPFATPGAFQQSVNGDYDGFIAKFDITNDLFELANFNASGVQLAPNPCQSELRLSFDSSDTKWISIKDAMGKSLSEKHKCNGDRFVLNTENLASGVYFITVESNNVQNTVKFVKE